MLLEAWRIAQALGEAGIEAAPRSADVKPPGKTGGPVVRLLIGEDFSSEIVPVSDEELATLWSFRQGNFHCWPIVRPNAPLCPDPLISRLWHSKLADASDIRGNVQKKEAVSAVLTEAVRAVPCLLEPLARTEAQARGKHISKFRSSQRLPREVRILRWRIRCYLRGKPELAAGPMSGHKAIFALLFGKLKAGKLEGDGQIAFDLKEWSVYSPNTRQAVESALTDKLGADDTDHLCELSGKTGVQHNGKFPNPVLPVVANSGIAMFSMFRDAPANFRYGQADDSIVSLNQATVSAAHNALVYVTDQKYRGLYWRSFPNGKVKERREQADLLIAYALGVELAHMCDNDEEEEPDGPTYEEAIRPVLQALEGEAGLKPRATALLILLRQISNAQVQTVYCRTPLASEVLSAGKRWIEGQRARPSLTCASKKDRLISPAHVVRLLSKQWAGDPPKPRRLNGPSSGDALDFMLSEGGDRAVRATEILRLLLQRTAVLLVHVGSESRLKPEVNDLTKGEALGSLAEADRLCRLLALILNAKERSLEETTRSPAYLLGLLLGLVDTLHWAYCTEVRNAMPPSLGGSQLLGVASDDPTRALGDLLERIRPWHDWADTAQPKDSDQTTLRAKKALVRLSSVAPLLAGRLPGSLDDTGKAELLLGFLSRDAAADTYTEARLTSN